MAAALVVLRRALAFTKASAALIHSCLLFFVITPVMPLLGSQINYDNLVILLVSLAAWRCLRFLEVLREQKVWRWDVLLELLIICLVGSLVKYAFLPIFAVFTLFVGHAWWRTRPALSWRKARIAISKLRLAGYVILIVLSAGLFVESYGTNIIRYHTPTPECDQVLSVSECQEYAPWARNYYNMQHKTSLKPVQQITYPLAWLKHSMSELVFTIGSGYNKDGIIDYYVGTQLPVVTYLGWAFLTIGLLLAVIYRRWYWQNQAVRVFAAMSAVYLLALLGQSWLDYLHLGQLTAIHGRYLLPILPFLYVVIAMGIGKAFSSPRIASRVHMPGAKAIVVVVAMVLMTQGGGIVTYIVRSDPWWFWPQSSAAQHVNATAKQLLKPLVIGV
jgi:hypothetical protein